MAALAPDAVEAPEPFRVVVRRPGLVDIDVSAADVPVWTGPDPAEFLAPDPPSGESVDLSPRRSPAGQQQADSPDDADDADRRDEDAHPDPNRGPREEEAGTGR